VSGNALIYARVSSDEQARGYSLDTQIVALRRYCDEQGYTVAGEFSEAHTGTVDDRPGINALLDTAKQIRADAVVLYDVDRLGRELLAQAVISHDIEQTGARLEYVLTGEDELLRMMKGALAVYENRQRVERSRRGKLGRVNAGYPLVPRGRAPFGYDYIAEPHKGYLVLNDEEAAIVRQMYDWLIVARLSSYEIARRLTERGVLTRGDQFPGIVVKKAGRAEWAPATVRRMLANSLYKGEWFYGKTKRVKRDGKKVQVKAPRDEWAHVDVPAIVDADTWQRAQAVLTENRTNAKRNAKREYLLRGMVFCTCGRRMGAKWRKRNGFAYYRCWSVEGEHWINPCDTRFGLRHDHLDAAVMRYVGDFLRDESRMVAYIQQQQARQREESERQEARRQSVSRSLGVIDAKLGELLNKELEGYPAAVIDQHKTQLLEQRAEHVAKLARIEHEQAAVDITDDLIQQLRELSEIVNEALPEMTPAEQRKLLEILRVRVDVIDARTVKVSGIISEGIVALAPC
jgi:site-specific DNA recombinase